MNAYTLNGLKAGMAAQKQSEDTMEQVRELLLGDLPRRVAALEARLGELDQNVALRLDALRARIEALQGEVGADKRSAFEELARSVSQLGDDIRRISRG